jgi:hypothetical protein
MAVKVKERGSSIFASRGVPRQANKAPTRLPRTNEMRVATESNPIVQGIARATISSTRLGKKASE